MSSTMLEPSPAGQGRISQLLPTVKCSTCHPPVPLSELGEHTCSGPPPVPTLPKPSVPQEKVNKSIPRPWMPSRHQSRVCRGVVAGFGSCPLPAGEPNCFLCYSRRRRLSMMSTTRILTYPTWYLLSGDVGSARRATVALLYARRSTPPALQIVTMTGESSKLICMRETRLDAGQ